MRPKNLELSKSFILVAPVTALSLHNASYRVVTAITFHKAYKITIYKLSSTIRDKSAFG
jgi:hypothetical protein